MHQWLAVPVPCVTSGPCGPLCCTQAWTIVGGGRVGQALADMGSGSDVSWGEGGLMQGKEKG